MHHSEVQFIEKTKPILKKLWSYLVTDEAENTAHLYHDMKTSFAMGKHFQLLQLENLRNMVSTCFCRRSKLPFAITLYIIIKNSA